MFEDHGSNTFDAAILEKLVRVGKVSAVDEARRMVRVHYDDMDITSGWLYVVGLPHSASTTVTVSPTASSGNAGDPSHAHSVSVSAPATATTTVQHILPRLHSRVLVLYIPLFSGDGFVLGEL